MSEVEKGVIVSVDVFNSVTEYLSNRPYREVNQLIDEMRSTTRLIDRPEESGEENKDD